MSEYEQILKRAREQGIDLSNKNVLIPTGQENAFLLNGGFYDSAEYSKRKIS